MRPFSEQFTLRGIVIGIIGCVIITASSVYLALKLGALPWPIFFVVLLSLFSLKGLARFGRPTNINEANVSATVMTAGAMVAGGLAFTIPGIYILMPDAEVPLVTIMLCALCGVVLGCIGTALFRKQFIEDSGLPYIIGVGAAETLEAGDAGGHKAAVLFSGVGISGLFAFIRDGLGALPTLLMSGVKIPGVIFGVYCSPMVLAMGFMIGPLSALVWFIGGVIGDFGVVVGGTSAGLWSLETGQGIKMSLGIGVMIGCGFGIVVKVIVPKLKALVAWLSSGRGADAEKRIGGSDNRASSDKRASSDNSGSSENRTDSDNSDGLENSTRRENKAGLESKAGLENKARGSVVRLRWAPFAVAAVALIACFVLNWGILASLLVVLLVWVVMMMAAQCTGQAGMNPMEVFGLIVLLIVAILAQIGGIEAFLVAATATVCCAFVGDLMNDFKAGHILKTDPRAQWFSASIGGVIGALVGALVIAMLVAAYGADSFGADKTFVAAQATAISSLVGGIPNLSSFIIGMLVGLVLYLLGAPVITLGLGIYLPFYLSLTIGLGALVRVVVGRIAPKWSRGQTPIVLASGLLAGESIVGIIFALVVLAGGIMSP